MHALHRSNLFYCLLLLVFVTGSLLINTVLSVTGLTLPHWVRMIIQYALLFALPIGLLMKQAGLAPREIGFTRPTRTASGLILAVILALLLQPVLMLLSQLSAMLFHNNVNDTMETIIQEPFILSVLGSAILPALFEESAFRGVFLMGYTGDRARPNVSPWTACLFCALAFAGIHISFQQFPYAFVSGFILAMLALYTGSLFPSMLTHAGINLIQLIMAYTGWNPFENTVVLVVSAAVCCLMLAVLWFFIRPKDLPHGRYMIRKRWREPEMRPFWEAMIFAVIFAAVFG